MSEPDEIKMEEISLPEARNAKVSVEQMDATTKIKSTYAEQVAQNEGRVKKTEEEILATNEKIRKAVEDLNKKMVSNTEAVFGIHDGTNRVTIKMVDKTSKKVIREYPPEETLDMLAKIWELAGMMIDEKG
ncbi:MAG: flagellar protein FlaG [Lachnospiraceae bacterium]|nr:flagellar protein FlaG [Lachnospiraceae bacterium]MBF1026246.1 flagellar protein FlaG [Lachnospiraceae bacterium]